MIPSETLLHDNIENSYLLVCEHIRSDFTLLALHEFDIGLHSFLRESLSEQIRDVTIRMQATELQANI
jgi:hypothetical protein